MLPSYVAVTCPSSVLSSATWPSLSSTSRPPLDHSHGHACHHKKEGEGGEAGDTHTDGMACVLCEGGSSRCLDVGWLTSGALRSGMNSAHSATPSSAHTRTQHNTQQNTTQHNTTHHRTQHNTTQHHTTPHTSLVKRKTKARSAVKKPLLLYVCEKENGVCIPVRVALTPFMVPVAALMGLYTTDPS